MKKAQTTSTLNEIKKKVLPILKRHDVVQAAVFGSVARGEAPEKSDLDLLVTLPDTFYWGKF